MSDLENRKQLGKAHLNANRLESALDIFAQLVDEHPEDPESLVILGDCYLAGADYSTSQQLYQQALEIEPESPDILRRVQLTKAELLKQKHLPESFRLPTSRESLSMLLQDLTGRAQPVADDEIRTAADLLQEMVNSSHPADVVARNLDQIDVLLPALLELNIKQAEADGKPDLAAGLQNLQENIQLQKNSFPVYPQSPQPGSTPLPDQKLRVLVMGHAQQPSHRSTQILQSLSALDGVELIEMDAIDKSRKEPAYDLVLAINPHADAGSLKHLADFAAENIPVILDLETDFENLPIHHPFNASLGLGTPSRSKTYAACLSLADVITTPSAVLAGKLQESGHHAVVIPYGWDQENPLWKKPSPSRNAIHLGWIGSPGHLEDVASVRRSIVRILREFPQTQLVVSGDSQVYQLFDNIPEYRRLFLPDVNPEDFPSLLAQVDIRLIPLRNSAYNRSASDRSLIEAGARNIPWVASPVPAYEKWSVGGRIAREREDWYTILKEFIQDPGMAEKMAQEGEAAARARDVQNISLLWNSLFHSLSRKKTLPEDFASRFVSTEQTE